MEKCFLIFLVEIFFERLAPFQPKPNKFVSKQIFSAKVLFLSVEEKNRFDISGFVFLLLIGRKIFAMIKLFFATLQ